MSNDKNERVQGTSTVERILASSNLISIPWGFTGLSRLIILDLAGPK